MAFTVETGSGVAGANALVSVADADTYWADRGSAVWVALTTAAKQTAIVQASEYLSASVAWKGVKLQPTQYLAWPRYVSLTNPYVEVSGVPAAVKNATARLALFVANGNELYGAVVAGDLTKRVKAGSVEVEFSDAGMSVAATGQPSFPWLLDLVKDYMDAVGNARLSHKLERT